MKGWRDGQGSFGWGGGWACVRSRGSQAVGASLLLSGAGGGGLPGGFPPEEAARNPALEASKHYATVVAVSIFHCQKRYPTSVIYVDFLVFFSQ